MKIKKYHIETRRVLLNKISCTKYFYDLKKRKVGSCAVGNYFSILRNYMKYAVNKILCCYGHIAQFSNNYTYIR